MLYSCCVRRRYCRFFEIDSPSYLFTARNNSLQNTRMFFANLSFNVSTNFYIIIGAKITLIYQGL